MIFTKWYIDTYNNQFKSDQDSIESMDEEYKEWCYINGLAFKWN